MLFTFVVIGQSNYFGFGEDRSTATLKKSALSRGLFPYSPLFGAPLGLGLGLGFREEGRSLPPPFCLVPRTSRLL